MPTETLIGYRPQRVAHPQRIMEIPKVCEQCRSPVKCIPAGVSKKTGKRYSTFYACENRNCSWTLNPDSPSTGAKKERDTQADYEQGEVIVKHLEDIKTKLEDLERGQGIIINGQK